MNPDCVSVEERFPLLEFDVDEDGNAEAELKETACGFGIIYKLRNISIMT